MKNWESDVALYLLAGFVVVGLLMVETGRGLDLMALLRMMM